MNGVPLQKILEAFNAPINEEQAWAVCYQCARYLHGTVHGQSDKIGSDEKCLKTNCTSESKSAPIDSTCLLLGTDGNVEGIAGSCYNEGRLICLI